MTEVTPVQPQQQDLEGKDESSVNQSLNYEAVCRTALAIPGLLKRVVRINGMEAGQESMELINPLTYCQQSNSSLTEKKTYIVQNTEYRAIRDS